VAKGYVSNLYTKTKKYSKLKDGKIEWFVLKKENLFANLTNWIKDAIKKNCCLTISYEGKVISQRCRTHRPHCPLIIKKKCRTKTFKNGYKRVICCRLFTRGGKIVKRKCNKGRKIYPVRIKKKCKTKKGKKCNKKNCFRFKYNFRLKAWKKNKSFIK